MKQIYHVLLGLLAFIFMGLAYLFIKIFGLLSSKKQDVENDKSWLESFIILYLNNCMIMDPDTTDISLLSQGKLNSRETQSLLVYLKAYLHKIGEVYEPSDYQSVVSAIPRVFNIYVSGFRSESAVRAWCKNQKPEGSREEEDAFVETIRNLDKNSEDWRYLANELLTFRLGRAFTRLHSEDYWTYTETMLEDYIEPSERLQVPT